MVEEVVVVHVVDIEVEAVYALLVAHQFAMETVPILVGFSLEQLLTDQKQLSYPG